jgi:alcohol dehydrogenase
MPAIPKFEGAISTRVIIGENAIDQVGEFARDLGAKKILLVTDRGIVKAGHAERALAALREADLTATVFDRVIENPTNQVVEACVTVARAAKIDTIIGLGGGSSMDTAKGCNFLLTHGGRMQDYWGFGKATRPMLPLIAIPTTAGTGSECQSFALITDETTHRKMACGDKKAAARIAILDPTLTLTQPKSVTTSTGIDAIAHALETAVTKKRSELSGQLSRVAFLMLAAGFSRVLAQPDDLDARAKMQLGAAYAGAAIENSMLGAAHSAANPLTARFGIVHGRAIGLMLPQIVRFNGQDPAIQSIYAELAQAAGIADSNASTEFAWKALLPWLNTQLRLAEIPTSLTAYGIPPEAIPSLAQEATQEWTAQFNPRPICVKDFQSLYEMTL